MLRYPFCEFTSYLLFNFENDFINHLSASPLNFSLISIASCNIRITVILLCNINDTIMIQISQRQQKILLLMLDRGVKATSTIQAEIVQGGDSVSLVTIKREVKEMLKKGLLLPSGSGRSRSYEV